jgi:vanillate O-demethylase monooxygenase subunit
MDLTHEEFVHGSSIGQAELSEASFITTHDEKTVTVTRWMTGIKPPPFWSKNIKDKGKLCQLKPVQRPAWPNTWLSL